MVGAIEEATPQLPVHECKRSAPIPKVQRGISWKWCVGRPEKIQPALRTSVDFGDTLCCDRRGRNAFQRIFE
jgi:hypothetical protein